MWVVLTPARYAHLTAIIHMCQVTSIVSVRLNLAQIFVQATAAMWAVLTPAQYAHLAVGCPEHVNMLRCAETLAIATGQPSSCAVLQRLLAGGKRASLRQTDAPLAFGCYRAAVGRHSCNCSLSSSAASA